MSLCRVKIKGKWRGDVIDNRTVSALTLSCRHRADRYFEIGKAITMFRLDADKRVHFCDGVTRRDFLHAGSLGLLGLTMPQFFSLKAMGAVNPNKDINCIQLMLVGGPSQLDTWDMKPDAPASIRGPFKPIKTNVSGHRNL